MPEIIFKTIQTPEGYYVYDRSINSIFAVSESDFKELKTLQYDDEASETTLIQRFQEKGLLGCNDVTMIKHPASDYMSHYCSNRMKTLVLQVTQQCNLRCSYCTFGGLYYNRRHNAQRMSFDTAKKAIDFFLSNSMETESVHFGFYGGEPLLEFDLIKQCVDYIGKTVEGKKVTYGLTTNGTLLTDDKINFFYENKFGLTVSMDGSKHEHDANRVFQDGTGSFDLVIRNIARLKELHPNYAKRLLVSTVISPQADINHVLEHFKTDDVLSDAFIMMSTISPAGLKVKVDYEESFHLVRRYEFLKFLLYLIGQVDRQSVSDLVIQSQRQYQNLYHALQKHSPIPSCTHHGGPCLPSIRKLFVMTNGKFYPCEKVSESAACNCIGSIETGLDMERIQNFLNIGQLTADECQKCWALPVCSICAAQLNCVDGQTEFKKCDKLQACHGERNGLIADMYQMCVLHEFGYRPDDQDAIV